MRAFDILQQSESKNDYDIEKLEYVEGLQSTFMKLGSEADNGIFYSGTVIVEDNTKKISGVSFDRIFLI